MSTIYFEMKRRFRDTAILFWMFVFPIVLCVFFTLVLNNAYGSSTIDDIHISVVNNENYQNDKIFQTVLKELDDDSFFKIHVEDKEVAEKNLNRQNRTAVLELDENGKIHMSVLQSGIHESAVETFVTEYSKQKKMVSSFINDGVSVDWIMAAMSEEINFINNVDEDNSSKSLVYVEYFTTLAMGCLYSGFFGINSICDIQANLSEVGKRIQCASQSKFSLLMKFIIVNNFVTMVLNVAQFFVMVKFLNIDFGLSPELVLLTTILGSFVGNGLGLCIGSMFKTTRRRKTTILSMSVLSMCFLAGMMVPIVKYFVHIYVPVLDFLNPATLLTDTYLKLSMYGITSEFYTNIISLFSLGVVFYFVSYLSIRRQQYESL